MFDRYKVTIQSIKYPSHFTVMDCYHKCEVGELCGFGDDPTEDDGIMKWKVVECFDTEEDDEERDTLRNLLRAIHNKEGFNYLCKGNGYNVRKDELRMILKELLYALEKWDDTNAKIMYGEVREEFEDNITEYEQFAEEMPWYDNRWRED